MPPMLGAWLRGGLRLLPWLLLLGGLAASGWWRYYLAPRHMPYLYAGLGVLALVLVLSELDGWLARQTRRRAALRAQVPAPVPARPPSLPDWLEAGVHWLPLLLLLVLGPTTLTLRGGAPSSQQLGRLRAAALEQHAQRDGENAQDGEQGKAEGSRLKAEEEEQEEGTRQKAQEEAGDKQPASKDAEAGQSSVERWRGELEQAEAELEALRQNVGKSGHTGPSPELLAEIEAEAARRRATEPAVAEGYAQLDLVDLYMGRGGPPGAPVELVGRLHKVRGDDPVVPLGVDPAGVEVVLYRYAIFCCVADAVPATAVLEGAALAQAVDEQWVRLRGRFHLTGATGDIPLLKVDSIEPVPAPDDPYLLTDPDMF